MNLFFYQICADKLKDPKFNKEKKIELPHESTMSTATMIS